MKLKIAYQIVTISLFFLLFSPFMVLLTVLCRSVWTKHKFFVSWLSHWMRSECLQLKWQLLCFYGKVLSMQVCGLTSCLKLNSKSTLLVSLTMLPVIRLSQDHVLFCLCLRQGHTVLLGLVFNWWQFSCLSLPCAGMMGTPDCSRKLLAHSRMPRLEITTQKLY